MNTKRYEQKLEILEGGQIQCRLSTIVVKADGTELPPKFHRHVIDVGDDLTGQSARVKAVAPLIWTQTVRDARAAFKADPEAVQPVAPGIVERTHTVNHVLPNGAIVAQVCDIVEEDGVEIGREYRPNRLVDVEADTANESEQIRGLALGTWTQEVKDAANSRREVIVAEITAKAYGTYEVRSSLVDPSNQAVASAEGAVAGAEVAFAFQPEETQMEVNLNAAKVNLVEAEQALGAVKEDILVMQKLLNDDATAKAHVAKQHTDIAANNAARM